MNRMTTPLATRPPAPALPPVGPHVPQHRNRVLRFVGRWVLRLFGWRLTGAIPDRQKFVVIVAPHTSNWDFPVGLAAKWAIDFRVTWLGKDTLFKPPLGWFMRAVGGIPVNRATANALVEQCAAEFAARDQMIVVLAPEGTRHKVTRWRSGFWHIARAAGVPIVCSAIDWGTKEVRFGPTLMVDPDADPTTDIARIQAHYDGVRGYHRALETDPLSAPLVTDSVPTLPANRAVATLGGGCFWCLDAVYRELRGVHAVVSGYAGGARANPTYEQVCTGATGHAEVVQVHFDPAEISYRDLLDVFFVIHDPTTLNRQGYDKGTQYRSVIFTHDAEQETTARGRDRASSPRSSCGPTRSSPR